MSVMSNTHSVTAVFSCLIPSSDDYSSGQESVTATVGEEQEGRRGGRQRGGEEERE